MLFLLGMTIYGIFKHLKEYAKNNTLEASDLTVRQFTILFQNH